MSRKGPYQIVHDYEATARKECSQGAKRGHTTAHMLIIARRFTSVIRKDLEDGDVGRDEELGLKKTSVLAIWQTFPGIGDTPCSHSKLYRDLSWAETGRSASDVPSMKVMNRLA